MEKIIDLRSDTVTIPPIEMLQTIQTAQLGDDIQRDDPTVKELERKAAQLLGMEDALLAISGTMANQIAVMVLTNRGDEIIVPEHSHIYNLEVAGLATLSQVQARPIPIDNRVMNLEQLEQSIYPEHIQTAETTLICLENTYDLNRGQIIAPAHIKEVKQLAAKHHIPVYLDGARLFNASVALGVTPEKLCADVDAVQFCLTKGLGCPLGSILAGSRSFIEKGRRIRQRLGGGMRQAGIIAAPALYALEHMIERLSDDHLKAKSLKNALSSCQHITIEDVDTNILSFTINHHEITADILSERLKQERILVKKIGNHRIRLVTHYDITSDEIQFTSKKIHEMFASL